MVAVVTLVVLSTRHGHAQWLNHPTPNIPRTADGTADLSAPAPRSADGKPDLSGLWTRRSRTNSGYKPIEPGSVDAVVRRRNENFGKASGQASCLPLGPGYLFATGPDLNFGMTKMIQTPGLIMVLNPDLTYRQIFTDGRALEADPNPSWMGYSVGRWEGDTLVVESAGFNDRTWLLGAYPHTEGLRAIERYRRPDGTRSDDQRSEVRLSERQLARYAGTYSERTPHWQDAPVPRVFEIRLVDGALFLASTRLMPQSETVFINSGLAIEFVLDDQGRPTHLFDKHVSGDYRFDRAK